MPLTNASVAAAVRAELARAGVSARQLGRDLGWSARFIHRRLTPKDTAPFRVEELARIAEYLGVPVATFVADEERPGPPSAEPAPAAS